ncbi:uncharacterized protein LOC117176913 [Belonocnema kinseyi]|uniref:uncharacterized protein LOC117176913 n=1 Tax=Belonocnema kinseyi TaxID=2817044 RepID=UPI00143D0CAC|nr:uncharacterized protein LOC117176913 [Belonocnema kinseyi]
MKIVYGLVFTLVVIFIFMELSSQSSIRDELMMSSKIGDSSGKNIDDSPRRAHQTLQHLTTKDFFEFPRGCNLYYATEYVNYTQNGEVIVKSLELIPFNVRYKVQKNEFNWIFGFLKDEYLERLFLEGKLATISAKFPHRSRFLTKSEIRFLIDYPNGLTPL